MENQKQDTTGPEAASIFTRMLAGLQPCHLVAGDDRHAALLEPSPLIEGHTLVLPRKPVDSLFDLPDTELAALAVFAKRVARALREAYPCDKVAVLAYGLKVRHAHLHLVPARGRPGEIDLCGVRSKASESDLARAARRIRTCWGPAA